MDSRSRQCSELVCICHGIHTAAVWMTWRCTADHCWHLLRFRCNRQHTGQSKLQSTVNASVLLQSGSVVCLTVSMWWAIHQQQLFSIGWCKCSGNVEQTVTVHWGRYELAFAQLLYIYTSISPSVSPSMSLYIDVFTCSARSHPAACHRRSIYLFLYVMSFYMPFYVSFSLPFKNENVVLLFNCNNWFLATLYMFEFALVLVSYAVTCFSCPWLQHWIRNLSDFVRLQHQALDIPQWQFFPYFVLL